MKPSQPRSLAAMKIITGSLDYCVEFKHRILQALRKDSFCSILSLQGASNRAIELVVMPNSPLPEKTVLAIRVDRILKARLEKAADAAKMTLTDYVADRLFRSVAATTLTNNELAKIQQEIEQIRRGRAPDQRTADARSPRYPEVRGKEKS